MKLNSLIYLDNNATTATDTIVVEEMLPYFYHNYGNPSSNSHLLSWKAEEAVFVARQKVAKVINALPKEVYFTSGATEGNNMILKGLGLQANDHIITSNVEHKCVLESADFLMRKSNVSVTFIPVNNKGIVSIEDIKSSIMENTKLISIMYVNNEIHSINDIESIGKFCREKNILFHVDAAQAIGKMKVDVVKGKIDFLTLSSHKFYGTKGIGAVFIREDIKHLVEPLLHGGGQEHNFRSGTLPLPLIVGIGKAAEIALDVVNSDVELNRIKWLSEKFLKNLTSEIDVKLNGLPIGKRQVGGLSLVMEGIDTGELQFHVPNVCYSRGSACSSGSLSYSYVLKAIGLSPQEAIGTMRICVSRFNTEEEITLASESIVAAVKKLTKSKFHFFKDIIK